jgi:putative ABC transport system permease protein
MFGARWYKVFYDLSGNKTRTALIVLSIAVGLFAIGMIVNARIVLSEELTKGYAAINPSSGTVRTVETFDENLVRSIRRMEGVRDADGRAHLGVRFQVKRNGVNDDAARWRDLQLFAVPDYDLLRVNKIRPQLGAWPPPAREILIERSAMEVIGAQIGDVIVIETASRKVRELRIAGTVHDLAQLPAQMDGTTYGYIAYDTLEWLGESRGLNELHIIAQNPNDKESARAVINHVKDRLERNGYTIPLSLTAEPGQLPLGDLLDAILLLLGVLGFLSLFLSAFLIVNTISALVTQQIRHIGIMKAVGARASQIVGMYLLLVLCYGIVALVIAVPLGIVGADGLCRIMAAFFNFDLNEMQISMETIALQVGIGLLAPILAALYPILGVLRITAAEAMSSFGVSKDQFGTGLIDRALTSKSKLVSRLVSRPLMLSLRNTFRRKGRLALTLVTLTLAGTIFIAIFSLRASLAQTLDDLMKIYQFDVWVNFAQPQRVERVEQQATETDGVALAKGWMQMPTRRVRPDTSESENIILFAPPVEHDLLRPAMIEGRWLAPDDEGALVLSTTMLKNEPDLKLGDEIVLKIKGRKATFRIVGITLGLPMISIVFANYQDIARVAHDVGQVDSLIVVTKQHDARAQAQAATSLETRFKQSGSRVGSVALISEEMGEMEALFNAVIVLALVMACLLALVGGLGLMGTLSINVLERTREIGVMRAIGAADGSVARVFIIEGVVIGVISWFFGTLLAIPLGRALSDEIGTAFLQAPLSYTFALDGVTIWFVVVIALSAIASFLPARSASRLTVRDVLAYE